MRLGTPDKEERAVALKLAGALWLTGAVTTSTGMLIPGAPTRHWQLLLVVAAFQTAWGIVCFFIPSNHANALTFHTPDLSLRGVKGRGKDSALSPADWLPAAAPL
jgi:hypothetical protein